MATITAAIMSAATMVAATTATGIAYADTVTAPWFAGNTLTGALFERHKD